MPDALDVAQSAAPSQHRAGRGAGGSSASLETMSRAGGAGRLLGGGTGKAAASARFGGGLAEEIKAE